tara:strand:+ start:6232 stop:6567 length:336 start_codon:yes stop_codon:yes gene_type:complete
MVRVQIKNNVRGQLPSSVEQKDSLIHGKGLFATKDISAETVIHRTHIMSWLGWVNIVPNSKYNHSEEENCRIDTDEEFKRLVSIRDIKQGEELLVNYKKDKDLEQPEKDWK